MKKNRIVTILVAVILFSICVIFALCCGKKNSAKEDYDIVFFGDSIVAGDYTEWSLAAWVGKDTGLNVLNAAFGGMTMSLSREASLLGEPSEVYSMYRLSEALLNKDFSLQIMASQKDNPAVLYGWYTSSKSLNNTDWDNVKYILIEHGANDYLNGVMLDDKDDKYSPYTYGGALRTVIENVQRAVPNAKIVLLTPIYMYPDGMDGDCNEIDYGGGLLSDYVSLEREIAAEYGLDVIDNFTELDINKDNYKDYLFDGLHGSEEGKEYMALHIAKRLEDIATRK